MGCNFSRADGCYSLTCCCCLEVDEACSWIAVVGLVWGGVATLVDFIAANLPEQRCLGCLDHDLYVRLSVAAGCINAVQWLASVLLLVGAKLNKRRLLLPWLAWGVVSLAMQSVWVALTLPRGPFVRAAASLFQLAWGAHFFIVVKTQYTKLALTFTMTEKPPPTVPPNTPARKHKRRWRRLHPACQPPIRTLLGAALRLQRALQQAKKVKELLSDEESDQEEEEDKHEDEEIEMRVLVESPAGVEVREDEGTCSRRRSGWKADGEWKAGGSSGDQDVWEVIIHSPHRDARGRIKETRLAEDKAQGQRAEKQEEEEEEEDEEEEDGKEVGEEGKEKNQMEEEEKEKDETEEEEKEKNEMEEEEREKNEMEEEREENEMEDEKEMEEKNEMEEEREENKMKDEKEKEEKNEDEEEEKLIHEETNDEEKGVDERDKTSGDEGRQR